MLFYINIDDFYILVWLVQLVGLHVFNSMNDLKA